MSSFRHATGGWFRKELFTEGMEGKKGVAIRLTVPTRTPIRNDPYPEISPTEAKI